MKIDATMFAIWQKIIMKNVKARKGHWHQISDAIRLANAAPKNWIAVRHALCDLVNQGKIYRDPDLHIERYHILKLN